MRIIKSFLCALALVVFASCQENGSLNPEIAIDVTPDSSVLPNPQFNNIYPMSFLGYADNDLKGATKTSIDGTTIKWAAHDGIYLFDGVAPRAFASDNDDVATTVNFEGSASAVAKYYAIYPSGTLSTVESKKVITTTIPTFQTATANTFAPEANVAVAYSESDPNGDGALQFKNIGAVVKFKLHANNTDVRKVRLDALNGEKMSGTVNVTFESNGTFSSAIVPASAESCVILESATDLNPANTFFMAVNPGTYEGGFKITLFKEDGSFRSISNTTSNVLARNDLMDFGTLPEVTEWYSGGAVDVLTRATTGITSGSSSYSDWSNKSASSSAKYAGNSAGGNDAIQLRSNNNNSGIVTTTTGGKASKVSVAWNANTAAGRTIDIYGKNTAYSQASDLYGDAKGTKIGSIAYGTSTELTISGDYSFIGIRSNNGALYLDSVSITWGDPSKIAPADPDKDVPSTALTNFSSTTVGLTDGSASFDVDSNVPWTISVNRSYASVSVTGSTVNVSFENLASGSRSATVTVTPSAGDPVSQEFTQSGNVSTEYDFSAIPDFSEWGNSYTEHEVAYTDATVTFTAACKQTSTITDIPVTKGNEVTLVMKNNAKSISNVTFVCRQWGTKAQTITLYYSTNGGTSYTTTGVTSTNFTISKNGLPAGTNAVKISFSSTSNQVGIESVSYEHN